MGWTYCCALLLFLLDLWGGCTISVLSLWGGGTKFVRVCVYVVRRALPLQAHLRDSTTQGSPGGACQRLWLCMCPAGYHARPHRQAHVCRVTCLMWARAPHTRACVAPHRGLCAILHAWVHHIACMGAQRGTTDIPVPCVRTGAQHRRACAHSHTCTHSHTHSHSQAHPHVEQHIHTHDLTHTHTHSQAHQHVEQRVSVGGLSHACVRAGLHPRALRHGLAARRQGALKAGPARGVRGGAGRGGGAGSGEPPRVGGAGAGGDEVRGRAWGPPTGCVKGIVAVGLCALRRPRCACVGRAWGPRTGSAVEAGS